MVNMNMPEYRITVDQLRPGVFVRLEKTSWFDHPFFFNNFKIKDQKQIALIKQLGITHLICIPEKSDVLPLRPEEQAERPKPKPEEEQLSQEVIDHLWDIKRERAKRLQQKKQRIAECEEQFSSCIRELSTILKKVLGGQAHSMDDALAFVDRLANNFLKDRESTLHLMNVMDPGEIAYSHSLNVAVLSMMVGKESGLDHEAMTHLGMAALFHDIGKQGLPKSLLKKRQPLSPTEQEMLEKHPAMGSAMLSEIEKFPHLAIRAVAHHHERMDGSGYPLGLKGEEIDKLATILAIADTYDRHCNHPDPAGSLTPYLALSYMFGQQKKLFDMEKLALFIRCLGVYPPGTVVQLSNGSIGMVMSVNPKNQLNPSVVLYDSEVPKKEALIVDLADEPDLKVEKSIRLAHLPPEIFEYLSPRSRITYFVNPDI